MKNRSGKKKNWLVLLSCISFAICIWIAFCGFQWSWGPFAKLHDVKTASLPGNDKKYSLDKVEVKDMNELNGKKMIFLGSSVTYGAASKGVSFVDYVGKRNQINVVKEAVSGTTLADSGVDSYISRMKTLDETSVDMFVCQLSTNDATQKKELGRITDSKELSSFDTKTVAGAIEYIIAYAKETWNCPVVFYTNPQYESEAYQDMVTLLLQIKDKWNIGVINMWDDSEFNNITKEQRKLYMADSIHPTQAGYLEWWTPYMEEKFEAYLVKQK